MKKILFAFLAICFCGAVFAFNPPVGGNQLFNLSSPTQMTSASSVAGGGIFMPSPASIAFNPALSAYEQRVQLDIGFTGLISTDGDDNRPFNAAFQAGLLIPTKLFAITAVANGVFLKSDHIWLGNTINARFGLAKEITDKLSVGININGGGLWGCGSDWGLGADVGVLYRRKTLGKLNDFRFGVSIMNLGKNYSADVVGFDKKHDSSAFPSLATLKIGIASGLFQTKAVAGGFSFDVTTPTFQDVIFDIGFNLSIKDIVFINLAEKIDVLELSEDNIDAIPAISVGVKFKFSAKKSKYLVKHNWDTSEMLTSLAWQQKYDNIQAVSAGVRIFCGQKDTKPPVIQVWDGE